MPDIKNIKRNTNGFSFIETVASLVNNKEYKSGYQDLIEGKTNDKTYFWTCLSAVGEEVSEVIYENVLNYVNNAANINTCRLKPLTSIARVLGVSEFAVLKNLNAIPLDVRNMMDVFSINRAYLLNVNYFDQDFVADLISSTLDVDSISAVSASMAGSLSALASDGYFLSGDQETNVSALTVMGSISEETYRRYVEECFFKLLSEKVFQSYPGSSSDLVIENLSSLYGQEYAEIQDYDLKNLKGIAKKQRERRNRNAINVESLLNGANIENLYSKTGGIKIDYSTAIENYKIAYNVESTFNQFKIANDIENGLDYLDNYEGGKLSILMLEFAERENRKFSQEGYSRNPATRYAYYNEREVIDYFRFINDTVLLYNLSSYTAKDLSAIQASYLTWDIYTASNYFFPYALDNNYSEISLSNNMTLQNSIEESKKAYDEYCGENTAFSSFVYDFYMDPYRFDDSADEKIREAALTKNVLRTTAMVLRDICFAIVDIREKLKTQSQRNYMTGTKLLIEYILDEYVANYLVNTVGIKPDAVSPDKFHIRIQEYDDPTEYYNGNQYFQDLTDNPQSTNTVGTGFNPDDVRRFYLSTLNIGSSSAWNTDRLADFMSAVFELGQTGTRMYLDGDDDSLKIDLDESGLSDGLTLAFDLAKVSTEYNFTEEDCYLFENKSVSKNSEGYLSIDIGYLQNYWKAVSSEIDLVSSDVSFYNSRLSSRYEDQMAIALTYGGRKFSYFPWYNYKNVDYASFQTHPYVFNFIEHDPTHYPIENAFYGNANEDLIYELQTKNLSVYLGEFGNIKRLWRNSIFDFSGYRSRYENYTHENKKSNSNLLYSVQHYDGTFYPPAIDLYKKYWKNEIVDANLPNLSGFDLLSAHMLLCVDNRCYEEQTNEDVPTISSMWHYYSQVPYLEDRKAERQRIVSQLIGLSAHILSVSSAEYREANNLGKNPHDVYKYGLDYLNNSFILLKRYGNETYEEASYETKRNTTGELWIRLNSHPIAFPAFADKGDGEEDLAALVINREDQISEEDAEEFFHRVDLNNAVYYRYSKERGYEEPEIYDFDLDENGKHLVFSAKKDKDGYGNAITYSSKLEFYDIKKYFDLENERTYFLLERDGVEEIPTNPGYSFAGYFQSGERTIYLGYLKKNSENGKLKSISLNAKEYPKNDSNFLFGEENQLQFNAEWLGIPGIDPQEDAKCCLGYIPQIFGARGSFSLVAACKILEDEPIEIRDFVGYNSISSKIEPNVLGKTDLIESSKDVFEATGEYNSFDRFSDYIVMYDVDLKLLKTGLASTLKPKVYVLNSDASYVPQYSGLSGQNLFYRMVSNDGSGSRRSYNFDWHKSNSIPIQSLELLGYSFQALADRIRNKESGLHEDENGKVSDFSVDAALNTTLRVYEDYRLENFVYQCYNSSQSFLSGSDVSSFSISLPINVDGLVEDSDLSNYSILLLNTDGGKTRNPLIAGILSYETVAKSVYNSEPTEAEDYILSIGFMPDKQTRIVGTPNPFDPQNSTFALDYSNHIFNIDGFESKLSRDETTGQYSVDIVLSIRCKNIDFVLQSGILRLFVYRNALDEFDKYHYMEPFALFPNNAALSCWAVPWKDKDEAPILYLEDTIELSDTWNGAEEDGLFQDRRSKNRKSLERQLSGSYLSATGHVVGHISNRLYNDPLSANEIQRLLTKYYLMDNIELSSITSFDELYELSTGQITWKISEEDKFDYNSSLYPPSMIDDTLYRLYGDTNKHIAAFNIFSLSNTYIFQLEDPVRIAELISSIAVPVGSVADQFDFVYEDYLSAKVNVDLGGKNILNYYEVVYDSNVPGIDLSALDAKIDQVDTLEEALSVMEENNYYAEDSEENDNTDIIDYEITTVSPEEISEYLKLYVNWRKYKNEAHPEQEEIELFFNLPNLFMTPYSFRNKDGKYVSEYKRGTYVRIKSGEDKYLNVVFQLKHYDMTGKLCGIRDLPILTYRIFNVSDDKPKFVITKTYEIDNRDGRYLYPDNNGNTKVYIVVDSRTYDRSNSDIDRYVGWNYTLDADFPASTTLRVISPIPLKHVGVEMAYERGKIASSTTDDDPEFVFEPTISKPGTYSADGGYVSAWLENGNYSANLEFTLLAGTMIDEESKRREFPIELLDADIEDVNGNVPDVVFLNGTISFDDTNLSGIDTGAYLARELNYTSAENYMGGSELLSAKVDSFHFPGWINEEVQRALVRMYNVGSAGDAHPIVTEKDALPIKTTGTRESRFDSYNDKPILYEIDPNA